MAIVLVGVDLVGLVAANSPYLLELVIELYFQKVVCFLTAAVQKPPFPIVAVVRTHASFVPLVVHLSAPLPLPDLNKIVPLTLGWHCTR